MHQKFDYMRASIEREENRGEMENGKYAAGSKDVVRCSNRTDGGSRSYPSELIIDSRRIDEEC